MAHDGESTDFALEFSSTSLYSAIYAGDLREQEMGYNIGILLGEIVLLVYVDVGVELINR